MTPTIEKKESRSGKTVGHIEKRDSNFIGTVTYNGDDGTNDTDTREFTTLSDAQGWLELTFMFMLGVYADR
ncbi:MAG: hypothetical protein IAF02_01050 [Anaerolineae bacterium]|nr:hypothetical protein [Anaerolineae bacterium]